MFCVPAISKGKGTVTKGGGFIPSSIAGLVMELYGTNLTGADNATIATWPDPFASSNPAQATEGIRPIKKTAILNGMPVARSDGSKYLSTAAPVTTETDYSIFCVYDHTAAPAAQVIFHNGNTASDGYGLFLDASDNILLLQGGDGAPTIGVDTDAPIIVGARQSGGTLNYKVSGTAAGSTAIDVPTAPSGSTSIFHNNAAFFFAGDIFAILIYDNDIGAPADALVRAYLADLTGITD